MYSSRLAYEPIRSIAASTFTGSYQALGTPLAYPSYILKIVNNGSVDVLISTDGVNDHDIVPTGSFVLYDESKGGILNQLPALQKGSQIYVKAAAGTGTVYLVTQYIIQV